MDLWQLSLPMVAMLFLLPLASPHLDALAGSSGDGHPGNGEGVPPPLAPSPLDKDGPEPHGCADAEIRLACGKIAYYVHDHRFEAQCNCHKKCRLTRTSRGSLLASKQGQGRPLGLLAAWLMLTHGPAPPASKDEHRDPFLIALISHEDRRAARRILKSSVDGRALLSFERESRSEEATSEPEVVP